MVKNVENVIQRHQDVSVIGQSIMARIVNLNILIVVIMMLNVQEKLVVLVIVILGYVHAKMVLKDKIVKLK